MFRTTLEQFRAPVFDDHESDKDGWSLNTLSNIREVFGENPFLWFIPIQTHLGDGLSFPHRRAKIFTNYQSIGECLISKLLQKSIVYLVSCSQSFERLKKHIELIVSGTSNPSRPETPNRTLVNPILTSAGTFSASQTIHSNSNSIVQSGKASVMSGVASPECKTEAVLDSNGYVRTVSVQSRNELTELVIQ